MEKSNSNNYLFSNNYYKVDTSTRPPFVKIEELNSELSADYNFYITTIDNFDSILYEKCLKLKNSRTTVEKEYIKDYKNKFKMSQNLHLMHYEENTNVELFDILSNRKPFMSMPGMGNMTLRSKYKLQLAKIYKNERKKLIKNNNFEITINDDQVNKSIRNRTSRSKSKRDLENTAENKKEKEKEKEKKFLENAKIRKNSFLPTHTVRTSEISKNRISVNIKDLKESTNTNNSKLMKLNDSLYNSCTEGYKPKQGLPARPLFVQELFRKYDYENLDPWKKVQNRTKDKSLCLSVIKDVYTKISNFFS